MISSQNNRGPNQEEQVYNLSSYKNLLEDQTDQANSKSDSDAATYAKY